MAINKKLIHFNNFEKFNSLRLSANAANTEYTIGINGDPIPCDPSETPDILWQSIVYIKDTQQQWTHGLIYNDTLVIDIGSLELGDTWDGHTFEGSLNDIEGLSFNIIKNAILNHKQIIFNWGNLYNITYSSYDDSSLLVGFVLSDGLFDVQIALDVNEEEEYQLYLREGFNITVSGFLNIKDTSSILSAQTQLMNDGESITYVISNSYNGNYPTPLDSKDTIYIDTEDLHKALFYTCNGSKNTLINLLKNGEVYYRYLNSYSSKNIKQWIKAELPKFDLLTTRVGDLITITRHEYDAEEFYSKYIDFNSINLGMNSMQQIGFNSYLASLGITANNNGDAIKQLLINGYFSSAAENPVDYPNTEICPLVVDGKVIYYTADITPNTQNIYSGKFWTGNMTGPGIYSYVDNPKPDIPDREEGEMYIGYVSPDGTQTLVSMKNPGKVFTRSDINDSWNKISLGGTAGYNTKYPYGSKLDDCLETGVCAYTPDEINGINENWTLFVNGTTDTDSGGYYHFTQKAICRTGATENMIFERLGWYKKDGDNISDLNFTPWTPNHIPTTAGNVKLYADGTATMSNIEIFEGSMPLDFGQQNGGWTIMIVTKYDSNGDPKSTSYAPATIWFNSYIVFDPEYTLSFGKNSATGVWELHRLESTGITGGGITELIREITYYDLKTLRDNAQLIPGTTYRITDYVTTTFLKDTYSSKHPFDLIVTALTNNTLSENAKVCLREGDTYFENNNLEAWEIKYCLDNDTSRFAWASDSLTDSSNVNINLQLLNGNKFINPFYPTYYIYVDGINEYVSKSDFFVEFGRETSPEGLENLLCIYKTTEEYEEEGADYPDKFFYCGKEEVDGVIYDKWQKNENGSWLIGEGDTPSTVYILTDQITVGDISYMPAGKGVIYYMKDEYNNECPYDFKNIMFKTDSSYFGNNFYYTFSQIINSEVNDLSLNGNCYSNIIKERYENAVLTLNNNVLITKNLYTVCLQFVMNVGISDVLINLDTVSYNSNNKYETRVARNSAGEIKIYCEADLIL